MRRRGQQCRAARRQGGKKRGMARMGRGAPLAATHDARLSCAGVACLALRLWQQARMQQPLLWAPALSALCSSASVGPPMWRASGSERAMRMRAARCCITLSHRVQWEHHIQFLLGGDLFLAVRGQWAVAAI